MCGCLFFLYVYIHILIVSSTAHTSRLTIRTLRSGTPHGRVLAAQSSSKQLAPPSHFFWSGILAGLVGSTGKYCSRHPFKCGCKLESSFNHVTRLIRWCREHKDIAKSTVYIKEDAKGANPSFVCPGLGTGALMQHRAACSRTRQITKCSSTGHHIHGTSPNKGDNKSCVDVVQMLQDSSHPPRHFVLACSTSTLSQWRRDPWVCFTAASRPRSANTSCKVSAQAESSFL